MLEAYQNKKIKKMESYLFSSRYAWGDAESGVHVSKRECPFLISFWLMWL